MRRIMMKIFHVLRREKTGIDMILWTRRDLLTSN